LLSRKNEDAQGASIELANKERFAPAHSRNKRRSKGSSWGLIGPVREGLQIGFKAAQFRRRHLLLKKLGEFVCRIANKSVLLRCTLRSAQLMDLHCPGNHNQIADNW
jgi:hypothetical protein